MNLLGTLWMLLLVSWFGFAVGTPTQGGINVCSTKVSTKQTYKVSYAVSHLQRRETNCGAIGWQGCTVYYKTYSKAYRTETTTVYSMNYHCCTGWAETGDTGDCTTPVCDTVICGVGGTCIQPNVCECHPGFAGQTCNDINECLDNYGGCDNTTELCINTAGDFYCECIPGYGRETFNGTCEPICTPPCVNGVCLAPDFCDCAVNYTASDCSDFDECLHSNGGCEQICDNYQGGYQCDCYNGYELSGFTNCLPVCEPDCQNNGLCVNPDTCECPETYTGERCETDVDECADDNGGCEQICENFAGSYSCFCDDGFEGTVNCTDINECSFADCDICVNTIGSFNCTCNIGYEVVDLYYCKDIDECDDETSGCSQECTNSIGSYECSCFSGWTLDSNKHTCTANPCVNIGIPYNSTRNCTGFTTGETCTFTCGRYHYLVGSSKRTCLSSGEWSGTPTRCEEIRCPFLDSPTNGYILFPCETAIETVCSFGCDRGYELSQDVKSTCLESGNWNSSVPDCFEIQACVPSPCVNGICHVSPSEINGFYCDCSGTGYTGVTCSDGSINTPSWPKIILHNKYNNLVFTAKPEKELIIEIITDKNRLSIQPSNLKFTPYSTTVEVSLIGLTQGFTTIIYVLRGEDAGTFKTPEYEDVYIYEQKPDNTDQFLPGYTIPTGCFEAEDQTLCVDVKAKFLSTEKWEYYDEFVKTTGVISLSTSSLQLPVSLQGYLFNINDIPESQKACNSTGLTADDIQWLMEKHSMYRTFIKELEQILPDWITLISIEIDPEQSKSSFAGSLISGENLKVTRWCENAPAIPGGQYFVYLLQEADLVIGGRIISLPFPPSKGKYCLAVGVCDLTFGSILFTFPRGSKDILNYIQGITYPPNLVVEVSGIAISTANNLVEDVGEGTKMEKLNIWSNVQYSYFINQSVEISGEGDVNVFLEDMSVLFSELFVRPWLLQQLGLMNMKLQWQVFGEDVLLEFLSRQTNGPIASARFGAAFNEDFCCCDKNGIVIESTTRYGVFDSTPFAWLLRPDSADPPLQGFLQYDLTPHLKIPEDLNSLTPVVNNFQETSKQLDDLVKNLQGTSFENMALKIAVNADTFMNLVSAYHKALGDDVTIIANVLSNLTSNCKITLNNLWAIKDEIDFFEQGAHVTSSLKEDVDSSITTLEYNRNDLFIQIQSTFVENTISSSGFHMTTKVCFLDSFCLPQLDVSVFDFIIDEDCGDYPGNFSDEIFNIRDVIWLKGKFDYDHTMNGFFTISKNTSLLVKLSSWEKQYLGKLKVIVNLLGINEATTMFIESSGIYLDMSGVLWGYYDCKLDITSDLTAWNSMVLTTQGEIDTDGQYSLGKILKDKIITIAEGNLYLAEQRIAQGNASLEIAQTKLDNGLIEQYEKEVLLMDAQLNYNKCVYELEEANKEVQRAQAALDEANEDVLELQHQIDLVCEIQECPGVCMPTSDVIQVTEDVYSLVPYECCNDRVEEEIVVVVTHCCYECLDCTMVKDGIQVNKVDAASAGYAASQGRWVKASYKTVKAVDKKERESCTPSECCDVCLKPQTIEVTFTSCSTCAEERIIGQITKPVVVEDECGYQIPDSECLNNNEYCREVRKTLYATAPDLAAQIEKLDNAIMNVSIKETNFKESQRELDYANSQYVAVTEKVIILQENVNNSLVTLQEIKKDVQSDLNIRLVQVNGSLENSLFITKITFNIELTIPDVKIIPMYVTATLLNDPNVFQIYMDFNNLNNSIDNAALFLTDVLFAGESLSLREKRESKNTYNRYEANPFVISQPPITYVEYDSVNNTNSYNISDDIHRDQKSVQTEQMCKDFTEHVEHIEHSFHTLLNIARANALPSGQFEQSEIVFDEYANRISRSSEFSVNESAAIIYFNLTKDNLTDSDDVPPNKSESEAILKLINSEKKQINETRYIIENSDIFPIWEATVNNHINKVPNNNNSSSTRLYECKSLSDCLTSDLDYLNNILENLEGYDEISIITEFIQSLLAESELNVKEAEYSALYVLNQTKLLLENNGICLREPVIVKHPVPKYVVIEEDEVEISCDASGVPPPTFSWLFNDRVLEGENSNTLRISVDSTSYSGSYVCYASNDVTSVQSMPCELSVEYAPIITKHPQDTEIDYGNPLGAFFVCNASAKPLAEYRWFFHETLTSELILIEGKNSTILEFLSPDLNKNGWYTCETSNKHGRVMSNSARLTILNVSMPEAASPILITFLDVYDNTSYINRSVDETIKHIVEPEDSRFNLTNYRTQVPSQKPYITEVAFTLGSTNVTSVDPVSVGRNVSADQMCKKIESIRLKVLDLMDVFKPGAVFKQDGKQVEVVTFDTYLNTPICPVGQYADDNGHICADCPPGSTRSDTDLPAVCKPCPVGFYQPEAGKMSCLVCEEGTDGPGARYCHISTTTRLPETTPFLPEVEQNVLGIVLLSIFTFLVCCSLVIGTVCCVKNNKKSLSVAPEEELTEPQLLTDRPPVKECFVAEDVM